VSGPGQVAAALLVLVALLADLLVAPRMADRTRRDLAAGVPGARVRMYRLIVVSGWLLAAVAVLVLLLGGLSLREIGFGPADLDSGASGSLSGGALVGSLMPVLLARLTRRPPALVGDIGLLLPATPRERGWYAASSVTAGITEEITYRALPIALLLAVLPLDNRFLAVLLAAVAFGLAHRYQGASGMALTAALGLLLGWIYVASHSLWPPMVLHIVLDLRMLLMPSGAPSPAPSPTTDVG
jgi:membrane protease YdiL (CAAX protease family)